MNVFFLALFSKILVNETEFVNIQMIKEIESFSTAGSMCYKDEPQQQKKAQKINTP